MPIETQLSAATADVIARTPRRQWPLLACVKTETGDWLADRGSVAGWLQSNDLVAQAHAVIHRKVKPQTLLLVLLSDERGLELKTLRPQGWRSTERR